MGKLIVTEFMTLDGIAQAPGAPDEDPASGFAFGGWQAPLIEDATGPAMFAGAESMDALLLGRKTYDIFSRYWPTAPEEIPFTGLLNGVSKYVASRTLAEPLSWTGSSVLQGDLADAVDEVKARHDEVHVIGSLDLLQSLLTAGLVDRLDLWVYPVVLGTGKRVFEPGGFNTALTVESSATYPGGTTYLSVVPSGPAQTGDMTTKDAELAESLRADGSAAEA